VTVRGSVSISGKLDLQKPDLSKVVVYLASDTTLDATGPAVDHATVAQKNKAFVPRFTVVCRGTVVEFPNWDDFDHNVFSRSKAAPAFDLDRYPRGQSKSRTFDKVGVIQIFCNIHPQMRAVILVVPNRYFAPADADGKFELKDVPPGKYEIVAWHERCSEQKQSLDVGKDPVEQIKLTLEESRSSIIESAPAHNDEGYGIERGLGVKREKLNLPVVPDSHPAKDQPK
jgi:plastocyanin